MNLARFLSIGFWKTENRRFVNFARYFALLSIAIGTMALILSLSVLEGYDRELRSNAIKFTSHIFLQNFSRSNIENYSVASSKLLSRFEEIESVEPIVQNEALIKSHFSVEGILFRGIKEDYKSGSMSGDIVSGKFDLNGKNKIIIGLRLAERLKIGLGDEVIIFSLKSGESIADFSYKARKFIVSGIYESKMAQYDDLICYISFDEAQKISNLNENEITNFEIMLKNISHIQRISKEIEDYLGYPFYAINVFDMHRSVFSWIELQKEPIPIILGLIIIIAALNIITTLLIVVIEKVKSIAILRSMGLDRRIILQIFLRLGINIGFWGSVIGASISLLFSLLQKEFELIRLNGDIYFLDVLPVEIIPIHYVLVIFISVSLSFLATLIPALIASKLNPLNAFKFK